HWLIFTSLKSKNPGLLAQPGFSVSDPEQDKGEHVVDFSKLIRELRLMIKQFPDRKFFLIWVIPFIWVVSQLITAIKG
ncbi:MULTISPECIES: hypothetical protein, partial [unclassified Cronobacter]|uniref:hypothetical protein n=1 Tax=unclassified Cronobacter TaxID=2649764 RepID=UPI001C87E8A3